MRFLGCSITFSVFSGQPYPVRDTLVSPDIIFMSVLIREASVWTKSDPLWRKYLIG